MSRTTLWDAAQSWLATTNLGDHKGNLSRVRKLFGMEMRLVNGLWREVASERFALSKTVTVAEMSHGVLEELKEARTREGSSAATVARELSLLRVLLAHAQTMTGTQPGPLKTPSNMRRPVLQASRATRQIQALGDSIEHPTFSYDERRGLSALAAGLSSHLRTIVVLDFQQGTYLEEACILKVHRGPRDGLELAAIRLKAWGPHGFHAALREAQVQAVRVWKTSDKLSPAQPPLSNPTQP